MDPIVRNSIDIDLQQKSREELIMELMQFRQAVRESAFDDCDSKMWSLLPEKAPPANAHCRRSWSSIMYRSA